MQRDSHDKPVGALCDAGSKSYLNRLKDCARATRLTALSLSERLFLPASIRRELNLEGKSDRSFRRRLYDILRGAIVRESNTPGRLGACVGLGVMVGILPIWGFQLAAAVVVAHALRLSKPIVVAASNISIPAFIPGILYLSLVTGRFVLSRSVHLSVQPGLLNPVNIWIYAQEYLLGSVIFAVAAGSVCGLISYAAARSVSALRRKA